MKINHRSESRFASFFNIGCSLITQDQSSGKESATFKAVVLNLSFDGLKMCVPLEKISRTEIERLSGLKYNLLCLMRFPGSVNQFEICAKMKWHRTKHMLSKDVLIMGVEFLPKSPEFTLALNQYMKSVPKTEGVFSKDKRIQQRIPVQGAMAELHLTGHKIAGILSPGKIVGRFENISVGGGKMTVQANLKPDVVDTWKKLPAFRIKLFIPGLPNLNSWGARLIYAKQVTSRDNADLKEWQFGIKWVKAPETEINDLLESMFCQWQLIQESKI